ncbi:hypothetical protein M5X11_24545 [Paenibacillus alginolyticus]|uniref:hypothetical protein n=1 Tax=Paenibacillus alginolyticus TaxID=59839 RepID=UPI0004057A6F|nr:hypothetical protein [Paenibacillus alginolyticus]MCY9668056.1 hypothetical protein [Paenibacillus alginolyticus]
MYNNTNSFGNASQGYQFSQGFQGNNAQYQGYQKQYQPIGAVQSFYNQSNAGQANQGFNQMNTPASQAISQESFHTANYRGNQPGHDAYKRSDSSMPSQQQQQQSSFQSGYSSYIPMNNQFGSNQSQQYGYSSAQQQQPFVSSQYGSSVQSNQQPYGQTYVSPNAFHTANYRGNQPGHDANWRSDSSTPSQQSFQSGYGSQQNMQQNMPQQSLQSFSSGFNNPSMGQQSGYNSSF